MPTAPRWTLALAALFGLMGVGVSLSLRGNPAMLFPGATTADPLLASWIVRNLTTAVVLLATAGTRRADLLLVGFLGRAVTESGDLLLALSAGNPAGAGVPGVMLALEAAAMTTLWRASRQAEPAR